jgi:NhaP-type Na+/H+ or K+/H+ antiporter
MSGGNA